MTIEERLENVERELRRQKRCNGWLLGAILLVAGGLIVPAVFEIAAFRARAQEAGTAKVIRANAVILEDKNGTPRAGLSALKVGPFLTLYDEKGETRVGFGVNKNGPSLALYDENGNPCIGLSASKAGPGLTLFDKTGGYCAVLSVIEHGPNLTLYDKNSKPRVVLSVVDDGPTLELFDENYKLRFSAGKTKTVTRDGKTIEYPESSLILYGPDGKVIWSAIE